MFRKTVKMLSPFFGCFGSHANCQRLRIIRAPLQLFQDILVRLQVLVGVPAVFLPVFGRGQPAFLFKCLPKDKRVPVAAG